MNHRGAVEIEETSGPEPRTLGNVHENIARAGKFRHGRPHSPIGWGRMPFRL